MPTEIDFNGDRFSTELTRSFYIKSNDIGLGADIYVNNVNTQQSVPGIITRKVGSEAVTRIQLKKTGVSFDEYYEVSNVGGELSLVKVVGGNRIPQDISNTTIELEFTGKLIERDEPEVDNDKDCVKYIIEPLPHSQLSPDFDDPSQPTLDDRTPITRATITYSECDGTLMQRIITDPVEIWAELDSVEVIEGRASITVSPDTPNTDEPPTIIPPEIDPPPPPEEGNLFTVTLNGSVTNIILIKNEDEDNVVELTPGKTQFYDAESSSFRIRSNDTSRSRITAIKIEAENQNTERLIAYPGESLDVDFNIVGSTRITISAEPVIAMESVPTLELLTGEPIDYSISSNKPLTLDVATENASEVVAVIGNREYRYEVDAAVMHREGRVSIDIPNEAFVSIGTYKVILIPTTAVGDGAPLEVLVNVINIVEIPKPDVQNITYPSRIKGPDFVGTDVDFTIKWKLENADGLHIYFGDYYETGEFLETTDESIKLNVGDILQKTTETLVDGKTTTFVVRLLPFVKTGQGNVFGYEERLSISFTEGDLSITREEAIRRIYDTFDSQLDRSIFAKSTSNLLTHFLHLGDGDNKVISNWVGSENSLVVKLYEPLPTNIQTNQQVWISKIQSNPLIETVTLLGTDESHYPSLQGPNFSLAPDEGTGYKIYEEIVGTDSDTSTKVVNQFISKVGIDTSTLDIQYVDNPYDDIENYVYTFDQFVHFGSAEERVKNYKFKLELIDSYETKIDELNTTGSTEEGWTTSISQGNEVARIDGLIQTTIQNFDGFEQFLYEGHTLVNEATWYGNLLTQAVEYDRNNVDYLVNNLPLHIKKDQNNAEFLLFLDMVAQHFDILWVYINGIVKLKKLEEKQTKGLANKLVYHLLESFGWNARRSYDTERLWEYAFGLKQDESEYGKTFKEASQEIWRRVINNLPYLLKHKGTARAMKAIMSCYGVPNSLLTIMEFGGPRDGDRDDPIQFTYEDRSAALVFEPGSTVDVGWNEYSSSVYEGYPSAIELRVNTMLREDQIILSNGSNWDLQLTHTNGTLGRLEFTISGSGGLLSASTAELSLFDDDYNQLLINRHENNDIYIYAIQSRLGRIQSVVSASIEVTGTTSWDSGSNLTLGGTFDGMYDEFRLWTIPLSQSKLENHALFPDAIDGNTLFSSTDDLIFRLDFERPQDLNDTPNIKNVAINTLYGEAYATASNFDAATDYPYQYYPYERIVTANVPSAGFVYSNKFRFEDMELIDELSYKKRATRRSFDRAPIDSNKLGLFLAANKELNLDIIKSFGDSFSIDNFIGDPSDQYKSEYKDLAEIRKYYFQRITRNINEYVQLVKYVDKSLFDTLADLAPARARVYKGLLIEPHILERSKIKWDKPTGLYNDIGGVIDADQFFNLELYTEIIDGLITVEDVMNFTGIQLSYEGVIKADDIIEPAADMLPLDAVIFAGDLIIIDSTYVTFSGNVEVDAYTETIYGEVEATPLIQNLRNDTSVSNLGFGMVGDNGYFKGTIEPIRVFLVKRERTVDVYSKFISQETTTNFVGGTAVYPVTKVIYELSSVTSGSNADLYNDIEPFPLGNGVISAQPVDGYLWSHYRTSSSTRHWTSLRNLYYDGCKQVEATTTDGLPPVQSFTTNPNILRVADTGRGSGEPILTVE